MENVAKVHFSTDGHGFYTKVVTDKDIFTVEITEEVTEDTEFDCLVELNDMKVLKYMKMIQSES
ncbi:hypothetical protein [Staphylococcus aureus]|uniref:hypothetical protein n=1 Tax=Staphylococcus aureus TaxID=1280 RepID=UPI0021ACFB6D